MGGNAVENGWRRFLDRLKRLWGKLRDGGLAPTFVSAAACLDVWEDDGGAGARAPVVG